MAAFNNGAVLADANGAPMNVTGYSASLTIIPESLGDIPSGYVAGGVDVGDVLRIVVTVSYDDKQLVLDGYRTRYAPNQP